ncbi:hypothetical protein A0H81_07665 [Grifola frondosa]|uniref:Uncharacterized protein n=1 Tax=Grifola frondosa TaxID=5627 RepID=A0A1C7M6A4_GRIFR|nr:hypothetical protein A0H81_07665 [Grifola frondosa]
MPDAHSAPARPTSGLEQERERDRTREQDHERARASEQEREKERGKERQRIQALERENATLHQRVSSLENELQSARYSLLTYNLLSSPAPQSNTANQAQVPHPPDAIDTRPSYDSLLSAYSILHQAFQERTEEITSLKSFLSKTDEWSGAQLIQALHDLNAEVVQLSASVAEEFSPSLDRRVDHSRQSDRELVMNSLGPMMTNLLATRDHGSDPTLVQFAIQAWEVCCIGRVLDSFCFGLPVEVDQILTKVFEHMHRAANYLTLARAHVHDTRALLAPQPQSQASAASSAPFLALNENNLRGLLAILALAGCTDSRGLHRDPLRARFGGALARMGSRRSGSPASSRRAL